VFDSFHWGVMAQIAAQRSGWEGWPFSGVGSPWLSGVARVLFVAALFIGLAWLLRFLFGPGGCMRPEEFGTGHIEARKQKKAEAGELRRRWQAGELSDDDYAEAAKALWKRND